ncbi:MAG TPA: hypothetical protein VN976_17785 [Verrucomicrobiae bacterium]|nr:hypothetical protein [Verrucomicrobiae bacterium]
MLTIYIHKCCVCFGILAFALLAVAMPTPPPDSILGCWVVTKLLPTPGISGLSQKQVNAIIGTRLALTSTCASSGHVLVRSPEYSTKVLSDRDFFKLGYVSLSQIGVKEQKVTQVTLVNPNMSDMGFLGHNMFLRTSDIVIEVENDYFVAERAKMGESACKCEIPKAQ